MSIKINQIPWKDNTCQLLTPSPHPNLSHTQWRAAIFTSCFIANRVILKMMKTKLDCVNPIQHGFNCRCANVEIPPFKPLPNFDDIKFTPRPPKLPKDFQ